MSRFEFNEGVAHAKKIISDACQYPAMFYSGSGLEDVIANLQSALENKPKDYADGVRHVINGVKSFLDKKKTVTR